MSLLLFHQLLTASVLVLVFVAFIREWFSPDLTAMGAFLLLVLCGVLDRNTALGVFASSAPITIAAMFIMSAVLERTGLIEALASRFEWLAGNKDRRVLIVLLVIVAFLSAFVNNTPVVVVFLPIVLRHCRKFDLTASKFLIPLSYAAIVGGTCTIIGTSTNLIAASIAVEADMRPFSMFEVSKLGLLFVGITFVYLVCGGRRLIPDRHTLATMFESEVGREFLTQAYVRKMSPLVGKKFTDTPLAKRAEISVIEIVRERVPLRERLTDVVFQAGDQILLKTRAGSIVELNESAGLNILEPEGEEGEAEELGLANIRTESAVLMEGIIGTDSRLVGKSLNDLNLRQRFGVLVLAVHRRGQNLRERFQDVPLAFGDTLLVEGPVDRMNELFNSNTFINLSKPNDRPLRRRKAPIAMGALIMFMVGGAIAPGWIPIFALTAVLLTLMFRCIESVEAYEAVEWRVIFMIFGMLGLGLCLQQVQIAQILAQQTVDLLGGAGPHVVLACLFLLSAILTELISNNAVAALLTPIAIGVGQQLEVDPRPFVVAVMFASSASFVTPIGYQTNTYVYGAGGYRFADFSRVGLPLAIMLWMVASFAIPRIWPF